MPTVSYSAGVRRVPAAPYYSTNFQLTEGTISEGGIWLPPSSGWTGVTTVPGKAYGTQSAHSPPPYDDSYAIIDPARIAFGANQYVETVMSLTGAVGTRAQEVEHLSRSTQAASSIITVETDIKITGAFHLVLWKGGINLFVAMLSDVTLNVVIADGAVWRTYWIGPLCFVTCNALHCIPGGFDVQAWCTANGEAYPATGQPGQGYWSINGDSAPGFGWKSWKAGS